MKLKRRRLWSIIPVLVLGSFTSIVLMDRASVRSGSGKVHLSDSFGLSAENWWYDIKMKYRPARSFAPVTVATIDDASLERFGRWPWSRGVFAELTDALYEEGAKSVVFDVVFSEPEYKARELKQTLQVPVPGRNSSLQKMYKLSDTQVNEFTTLLPEIGDQYFGQSIWRHADKTVLGYFWKPERECLISQNLGYTSKENLHTNLELILKTGFRLTSAQDFLNHEFGKSSVGPLQSCPTINRGAVGSLAKWQGFFNAQADDDGVFRSSKMLLPMLLKESDREGLYLFPSLSLSALMAEYGADKILPDWRDYSKLSLKSLALVRDLPFALIALQNDGSLLIDFAKRGKRRSIVPTVSLARAGNWNTNQKKLIKDKIIFIGPTSTGVFDLRPNPVDPQGAGVFLHAAATSQLIEFVQTKGEYFGIQHLPIGVQLLALWCFLAVFSLSLQYSRRAFITGVWWPAILVVAVVDVILFRGGWASDFALIALCWALVLGTVTLLLYLIEERDRIFLKNAFARYVSPEIVRRIEENPAELNLGGERKEISVLFSDIRGFTAVSETLEPDELRKLLNSYFKPMAEIVQKNGGTVDKFIGDSMMALFGAPLHLNSHVDSAVKSAEQMMAALKDLHKTDARFAKFDLRMGIGVASGLASVGNMGTDTIFNYTALGDVVNLSSRIENLSKYYGAPILIADSTYQALPPSEQRRWRAIDRVRVAGKSKDQIIYDLPASHLTKSAIDGVVHGYAAAFSLYVAGEWESAARAFGALADVDVVSAQMLRRCELARSEGRSPDWDGVWNFEHK